LTAETIKILKFRTFHLLILDRDSRWELSDILGAKAPSPCLQAPPLVTTTMPTGLPWQFRPWRFD